MCIQDKMMNLEILLFAALNVTD
eukprot:COSAG02_NODE_22670_length_744_cov_1.579845_1_plen_22_part_10